MEVYSMDKETPSAHRIVEGKPYGNSHLMKVNIAPCLINYAHAMKTYVGVEV
jgi:hypothetical protein